jgi:hypothetical protein
MAGIWDFLTKKKKPEDGNDLQAVLAPAASEKKNFLDQFLPESDEKRQALAQGLLLSGAGMMSAGGPSATPQNFLSVLGQGVGSGVAGYNKSLENSADTMNARTASNANNAKMQQAQAGVQFASSIGAPRGEAGYSVEQLQKIFEYQVQTGDEAGARDTLGMIQQLQITGAKQGMIIGEDGFELAPGYAGSLFDTKKSESLGSAVGQNAQTTSDQKNFSFGVENPAFREYETSQRKASAATTNINNAGPKEGKIFEGMDEERKNAQNARSSLGSIYEAKKAIANGAVTGFGAETELAARKAAARVFGIGDPEAITNTETFRSAVAPMVATILKDTVGSANISNSDREFAEKAAGGSIALDSASISRLLDIQEKIQTEKINRFNSRVNDLYPDVPENAGTRTYFGDLTVPENPYAGDKSGNAAEAGSSDSDAVRVVVVGSEAAYEKLPPGSTYRFDSDPVGTMRTKR